MTVGMRALLKATDTAKKSWASKTEHLAISWTLLIFNMNVTLLSRPGENTIHGSHWQLAQSCPGIKAYRNRKPWNETSSCTQFFLVWTQRRTEARRDFFGYQHILLYSAIKALYISMHRQLPWNASVTALKEVLSPLESKMIPWTWELRLCKEAMAENSRWDIQEQAGRNIASYKPGLCFTQALLVIFHFQPCSENLDLHSS